VLILKLEIKWYILIIKSDTIITSHLLQKMVVLSEHQKSEIIYPNESCIYIKRKVINDVGLFNEEINDLKKTSLVILNISRTNIFISLF